MPKILVAWIGKTDIRAASGDEQVGEGPICQAITKRSFDEVFLLHNYPKAEVADFLRWLGKVSPTPIRSRHKPLSSPTNFEEIYKSAVDEITNILKNSGSNVDLTFHLSPGTGSMTAVWIILAKTRFPAELIESSPEAGVQTASVPFDMSAEFIPDLLRRPDEELERLSAGLSLEAPEFSNIIHRSPIMQKVIAMARRWAPHKFSVLIEGESGTGKELLARAIHRASPRRDKRFIPVNCGAIPRDLIESELFGHGKGAFTDAHKEKLGHFLMANGGTLFLDEIGELPLLGQVKMLRVLQEKEVTLLGQSIPKSVDVRIIAATNKSLVDEVAKGNFREDLYYRLAVGVLPIPPLRERQGDVGLLIDSFLAKETSSTLGLENKTLSSAARNLLLRQQWPGNVRELQNTLLRAAIWSSGTKIQIEDVRRVLFLGGGQKQDILNQPVGEGFNLEGVIEKVARHYLKRAYDEALGKKKDAAKLLGFSNYQTFSNWMKRYKVNEEN